MWTIFTGASKYKKGARLLAAGWTLLIFYLCFLPADEIPDLDIPFVDKWAHMVLFAGFSFFWLLGYPSRRWLPLLWWLGLSVFVGWLVEYIQGHYVPGRFQDQVDTLADAVGGLLGIIIFVPLSLLAERKTATKNT